LFAAAYRGDGVRKTAVSHTVLAAAPLVPRAYASSDLREAFADPTPTVSASSHKWLCHPLWRGWPGAGPARLWGRGPPP